MYRLALIGLCLIFAGLQYRLWIADGGYAEAHRLQTKIDTVSDRNRELHASNQALEAEIADLKNGQAAMEGRARTDLGMIRDGEQFYLVVDRPR